MWKAQIWQSPKHKKAKDTYINQIIIYPNEARVQFNSLPYISVKFDDGIEKDRPLTECVEDIQGQSNSGKNHQKADGFGGEGGIWTLAALITHYSLSRGAPSASWVLLHAERRTYIIAPSLIGLALEHFRKSWRRERDSNPRCFRTTVFKTVTIDHSDISPFRSLWYNNILLKKCQQVWSSGF